MAMKSCKITVHLLWNSTSQWTEMTWLDNFLYYFGTAMKFVVQKSVFFTKVFAGWTISVSASVHFFQSYSEVSKDDIVSVSTHLCKHTYTVPLTTNELSEHGKHVIWYELPTGWPTIDWASSAAACVHVAQGRPFQLQLNASLDSIRLPPLPQVQSTPP